MMGYLFGIDWASHQGDIDFNQLKAEGHTFGIGKATGEGDYVNPTYAANHQRAAAAGMITGSYDWIEPQDAREPEWLAADYLRVVEALGGRPKGHLLTVDFETPDWYSGPRGRDIEDFMRRYLYHLKDLAGQPVIVYTAPYFLQETGAVGWDWLGRDYLYWMAAPGGATGTDDQLPDDGPWQRPLGPPWQTVTLHQHQWYARSSAIGSGANFDRNRFNGTRAQLAALGYQGGISQAEVIGGSLGKIIDMQEVAAVANTIAIPEDGKFTAQIINGQTVFIWNAGGEAVAIDGINVVDIGVSVVNKDGETFDRSIQGQAVQVWHERRAG